MKNTNEAPSFLNIGLKILTWYHLNKRDLPWRHTKDPYRIWISEVVLQQTRVEQGRGHYERFVDRFPDIASLQQATTDDVLLHWKGLGYYSRALNLHKAAQQLAGDFNGGFPRTFSEILKLKGIGPYTAAAISSIAFGEKVPAVDGNFYRVLSRLFADPYDVSASGAHAYFTELALLVMPDNQPGDFNQAVMDLGSEICRPKKPICEKCPVNNECLAFATGNVEKFPVKSKKNKVSNLSLSYYFLYHQNQFLITQRDDTFIWKKLYEFPSAISSEMRNKIKKQTEVQHKLTHKNLTIEFSELELSFVELQKIARQNQLSVISFDASHQLSFPRPLQNFLENFYRTSDS